MEKNEIRKIINAKLKKITNEYIDSKSESILFNLKKSKLLENKKIIMFYLNTKNEVKTDFMLKDFEDKEIFLPKVEGEEMFAVKFEGFDKLINGAFNIREPLSNIKAEKIDAVIVPLVAVTRNGVRIGKGKGYYDRFLRDKNVLKIGICYDFQIVEKINKEIQDINLDYIITNKEIIKVENN